MIKIEHLTDDTTNSSQEDKNSIVKCDKTFNLPPLQKIKKEQKYLSLPPSQSGIMPNSWTFISSSNDGMSFEEGVTDKMEGLPDNAGKWMVFIERESRTATGSIRNYAWKIAKYLVMNFKNTGIISAKYPTTWNSDDSKGIICCYTADYKDKQSVKRAAEAIRKAYPYISDFYYKTENDSHLGNYRKNGNKAVTKYKYSRNKFYERGKYFEWQLVNEASQTNSTNYANLSSSVSTDEEHSHDDTDYDSDNEHTESKWTYISVSNDGMSFKEGVTDEMEGLSDDAGKWIMFNDGDFCIFSGMSHQNYAWEIVKKLVIDFKNTGIISAKCCTTWDLENSYYRNSPKGVICCYTADYKDKQSVKRAVEAIRKAYPYALDMYYQTEEDSYLEDYRHFCNEAFSKYKYTVGKNFYEMGEDFKWHLFDEASINLENIASTVATHEREKESKLQLVDTAAHITSINQTSLPSAIITHEWLYISSISGNQETLVERSEDIEDLPRGSGKWLLFHNKNSICPSVNMSHHDYAWQILKSLVINFKNTGIIAVKSSTSKMSNTYSDSQGVTCCYTGNFNNTLGVKKAADAIRKVYYYPSPMYYKTEESTISRIYSKRRRGNRVSIYQHFENNTMYERDCDGPWQPITI